jgi:hypothetical protein
VAGGHAYASPGSINIVCDALFLVSCIAVSVVRELRCVVLRHVTPGINRSRVEDMEVRLKADILAEAATFGNRILVVHENEDLSLYDHWEVCVCVCVCVCVRGGVTWNFAFLVIR